MTRPKGIHTKALTQQDHDRINLLYRDALRTRKEIEALTGFTESQIKRALATRAVGRGTGRPPKLSPAQEDELVAYVTASPEQQSMSYLELARALFGRSFGEYAIRSTLRRRGFCRDNGKTRLEPPGKKRGQKKRGARPPSEDSASSTSSLGSSGAREEEGLGQRGRENEGHRGSRPFGVASICE
ncbi:hypothetical protein PG985_011521 [Apiospora marii]|uniref:Transposase n=1 Tax=Apiospora marii TaxID=335849 RepID=A0ABR1R1L2_9PEZI